MRCTYLGGGLNLSAAGRHRDTPNEGTWNKGDVLVQHVREVMTDRPVVVGSGAPMTEAAQLMRERDNDCRLTHAVSGRNVGWSVHQFMPGRGNQGEDAPQDPGGDAGDSAPAM